MRRLRDPDGGCPWDLRQDFSTIAPYTIEEAYEVADAIGRGDMAELRDELGDLLLQVAYHAQMAAEAGAFGFEDVIEAITAKMTRRHPHVFGDMPKAAFIGGSWERMKEAERIARGERRDSVLDGVPVSLPGMTRAVKLQDRAARVGFDWPEIGGVIEKIAEEAAELSEAMRDDEPDRIEEEYGDLLFVVANLGRWLNVDPEAALRRVNAKFERRFRAVEAGLSAAGKAPDEATLQEMDALWNAAKAREKSPDQSCQVLNK